ncbi:flavodoxin [uncultured Thomasclavelia sp.]|uniref:flavodoxin n=1 Tax=uncultured Thomasclavelia sp. TaxID=3025759 RepID=UPI002610E4CE|nr:flavodoxin [uncultured Thomasclavelia sp.]
MKKFLAATLIFAFILAGCQSTSENNQDINIGNLSSKKALVAYFAYSENIKNEQNLAEDATSSASLNRSTDNENGNLQVMVQVIQDRTEADVFSIKVAEPYNDDYDVMRERAYEELDNETFPELSSQVENIDSYDIVYVGTPVWSSSLPRPVASFLSENDLTDKIIVPFGIHLGSGFGTIIEEIEELCPDSIVLDGFTINASTANEEVKDEFENWLDETLENE